MQVKFKVHFKNRELGPLTEAQIRKMLDNKQLGLTDKYHDEEKQDWIPLAEKFGPSKEAVAFTPKPVPGPKPSAPPAVLTQPAPEFEVIEASEEMIQAATPPVAQSGKVEIRSGSAMIPIKQVKTGSFALKIKSGSGLDLPMELNLVIKSAPASQIQLQGARECKAGEEILFELKALDAFENIATDFQASLEVLLEGSQSETCLANFSNGCATVKFRPTKAESYLASVKDSGKDKLALPVSWEVKVQPNKPARLIAEAPSEARAGEEIALKVTALDEYGNIVTDFQGPIDLEVETLPKAG